MSTAHGAQRKQGTSLWFMALLIALLAYPLSLGPLLWLHDTGWIPTPVAEIIVDSVYAPLVHFTEYTEDPSALRQLYIGYIKYWRVLP